MKKNLGAAPMMFPQPVLIIATCDEDGKANASQLLMIHQNMAIMHLESVWAMHSRMVQSLNKRLFTGK